MNFLFKIVPGFIVFVSILIILWWAFIGTIAVKSYDYIDQHGLKSAIDRIWEGKK